MVEEVVAGSGDVVVIGGGLFEVEALRWRHLTKTPVLQAAANGR